MSGAGPKDAEVLEGIFEQLSPIFTDAIETAAPGWKFFLLAAEIGGTTLQSIEDLGEPLEVARILKSQADRIDAERDRESSEIAVEIYFGEHEDGSVASKRRAFLIELAPTLAKITRDTLPDEWGYALFLFDPTDEERIYISDLGRGFAADSFRELADAITAGTVRPPGVLGREH